MPSKKTKSAPEFLKREPGWDKLAKGEEKILHQYCDDYRKFLSVAKTERLACEELLAMAKAAGFQNLDDIIAKNKKLKPGAKVYRSYSGKTVILAHIGKKPMAEGLRLVGGHIDCPRLDAKPCPLYEADGLVLLDTHYYGGIKKFQWVTIPLALHGVVIKKDGTTVKIDIGEKPEDPVFVITDLLPHLAQEQSSKKLSEAFSGEDLNVLLASRPADEKDAKEATKHRLLSLLWDKYGITEADFQSAELEVTPAGPARDLGLDNSMMLGYGHDDRVCAYASSRAILDQKTTPEHTALAVLCDKEEIGSYGCTGMDSTILENTVAELLEATAGYNGLTLRRLLEKSQMLSADVCALHDPGFPQVSSPHNQAKINCGLAISKYDGARGKSGSSDANAEFVGIVRKIFDDAGVVWQMTELGKVDVGGGGTIALYMARYGMAVLDCGVGLFNMHAPWEVAGKLDIYMAYKGYSAFLLS